MSAADYARLLLLASVWGGAFVFMRVAAPVLGAIWTAELRVLIGGLALLAWYRVTGLDGGLRRHARSYLLVGTIGIGMPFALYSYAATALPASVLSVINATAPMFSILWSSAFRDERLTLPRMAGLLLGMGGVAWIATPGGNGPLSAWHVAAGLAACCCYGVVGVLVKRFARGASAQGMAVGNQLAAALVLMPLLPFAPLQGEVTPLVAGNMLALAVLASSVAFPLYFRLITDVGATRALSVTYLIPLFGMLWGALFLGEALPASLLGGGILILSGTALVTRR